MTAHRSGSHLLEKYNIDFYYDGYDFKQGFVHENILYFKVEIANWGKSCRRVHIKVLQWDRIRWPTGSTGIEESHVLTLTSEKQEVVVNLNLFPKGHSQNMWPFCFCRTSWSPSPVILKNSSRHQRPALLPKFRVIAGIFEIFTCYFGQICPQIPKIKVTIPASGTHLSKELSKDVQTIYSKKMVCRPRPDHLVRANKASVYSYKYIFQMIGPNYLKAEYSPHHHGSKLRET